LRRSYPAFRELNAEILVVTAAALPRLAEFAQRRRLPFPMLSDRRARVYRAYGLEDDPLAQALGPRLAALADLLRRDRPDAGAVMHTGGDFVVDARGIVRFAHSSEDPTDRPTVERLLEVVAEAANTAG
jgi:peroxiredoxin